MNKALENVVVMEEPADGVTEYLLSCNSMAEFHVREKRVYTSVRRILASAADG